MRGWPRQVDRARRAVEAGLTLEAAKWLADHEPVAVGADNSSLEASPSIKEGYPEPVHVHLLIERGVYIMEWIYLEELAREKAYEFLFVCLPSEFEEQPVRWFVQSGSFDGDRPSDRGVRSVLSVRTATPWGARASSPCPLRTVWTPFLLLLLMPSSAASA